MRLREALAQMAGSLKAKTKLNCRGLVGGHAIASYWPAVPDLI